MQKNLILIILFLVLILAGGLILPKLSNSKTPNQQTDIQTSSPTATRSPNFYDNKVFGFTLEYPFNLQLKEASASAITIGTINDLETNSAVEIKVIEVSLKSNATESAAVSSAKKLCKNSMPNRDIQCDQVIPDEMNANGAGMLTSFYLREITTNKTSGELITTQQKGPFISVPITKSKTTETIVLFHPPLDKDSHLINSQLVRDIASSLKKY